MGNVWYNTDKTPTWEQSFEDTHLRTPTWEHPRQPAILQHWSYFWWCQCWHTDTEIHTEKKGEKKCCTLLLMLVLQQLPPPPQKGWGGIKEREKGSRVLNSGLLVWECCKTRELPDRQGHTYCLNATSLSPSVYFTQWTLCFNNLHQSSKHCTWKTTPLNPKQMCLSSPSHFASYFTV